ncbi:erythromycin esterase family protein [Halosimplex marinum]|uniref:erythromycin esterase family protein n=1 Tax=Halosimplex marinum TaxID=3396620 RepID=UPI003F544254
MTDDTTTDRATDGESTADDWLPADATHPLADRLAAHTIPIDTTDPADDPDDLAPVTDRLADARVVGLGEATHGTREFFRLKHRLVRLLVEELDYRLFALEANFTETLAIDEYVVHGRGDPKEALDGIYFWTWDTREVLALVEWLCEFNEGRPLGDRVRFYGVDAQFTAGPAGALLDFFDDRDADWPTEHRETLSALASDGLDVDEAPAEVDEPRLAAAEETVAALDGWFEREATAGDERAFALHRRHLRTLEQTIESARAGRDEGLQAKARRRDRAMAENLSWALDREPHDRVAVWGHSAHVQRDGRDEHWGTGTPMGAHLADRYGDDYYALGFDFAGGQFRALDVSEGHELRACSLGPPPEDAATRLFAAVDDPPWFLDFDDVDDERLADYFECERPVRSVGAIYDPEDEHDRLHDEFRLPLAFDGLVFVAGTTPARPVERE